MNLVRLLHLFIITSNKKVFVEKTIPSCNDCVFYRENGDCRKYGERDSFTNKIVFYKAEMCREDIFRCGPSGLYFTRLEEGNNSSGCE